MFEEFLEVGSVCTEINTLPSGPALVTPNGFFFFFLKFEDLPLIGFVTKFVAIEDLPLKRTCHLHNTIIPLFFSKFWLISSISPCKLSFCPWFKMDRRQTSAFLKLNCTSTATFVRNIPTYNTWLIQ